MEVDNRLSSAIRIGATSTKNMPRIHDFGECVTSPLCFVFRFHMNSPVIYGVPTPSPLQIQENHGFFCFDGLHHLDSVEGDGGFRPRLRRGCGATSENPKHLGWSRPPN